MSVSVENALAATRAGWPRASATFIERSTVPSYHLADHRAPASRREGGTLRDERDNPGGISVVEVPGGGGGGVGGDFFPW